MNFLPSSLASRTVLLMVAVVALVELVTFSLIDHTRRALHINRTAQFISGQVHLLQTVLPGLDRESRRLLASGVAGPEGMQLVSGATPPPSMPAFRFGHRLAGELQQRLGDEIILRHAGPGKRAGLWVGFPAGGERWWLILPPPRFEAQDLPGELWLWLIATFIAVVALAAFFVRGIVKPLARLGEAVAATGDGAACTVEPEGPKEVRQLAERHNTMLAQLAHADLERREMLAGLTHDLRAPLARLRVRLALLENSDEASGLSRDADDMERIVSQCLAFLRSGEKAPPSAEALALAACLRDSVSQQRELGRPVQWLDSGTNDALQVRIAPENLQRVLDNLIDNALQHGAPPVELSLTLAGSGRVAIDVRDHGAGILPADRERALEAFAQIEPARATRGHCGLGLAIVRRLIGAAGGSVELLDAPGGGLLVRLWLPLAELR